MTCRVCPLGDALTRGSRRDATGALMTPTHPSYRYTLDLLRRQRGYDFDFVGSTTYPDFAAPYTFDQNNEAHGGDTTFAVIAASVAGWIAGYTPDIVLLWAGREDAYDGTLIADRKNALTTIVMRLREKNPKVWILVGTTPPTMDGADGAYRTANQITPFNAELPAWAAGITTTTSPVIIVDMFNGFQQSFTLSDGRELSEAGDAWVAGRWIMALDTALPQWATATGGTYTGGGTPPVDPEPDPGNIYVDGIIPGIRFMPLQGNPPLEITYIDCSVVDQWTRSYEVIGIGVPMAYLQAAMAHLPTYLKITGIKEGVQGTDWTIEHIVNGNVDDPRVPWPTRPNCLCFHAEINSYGFTNVANGWGAGDGKVSIPVWKWQTDQNAYMNTAQVTHHEVLHTINGLESSDNMRVSSGFLAWLQVIDPANPFLQAPATYPLDYNNLELFYRYLDETYRTTPTLTNGAVSFDLDFGDGTPHGTEPDGEHIYTAPGAHRIAYSVTAGGKTARRVGEVVVTIAGAGSLPTAEFTANRMSGTAPFDVQFTYTGSGATRWEWSFGDGTTSTARDPAHVYSSPGIYTVTLVVENADGGGVLEAPNFIHVADPALPPAPEHMITPAGVANILAFIAAAWAWVQPLDIDLLAVGDRLPQDEAWYQDELGQVWVDAVIPAAPLEMLLPVKLGGVEIWDAPTGGNRIVRIPFDTSDPAVALPEFRQKNDSLALHIGVGLTGSSTTPRITDVLAAGSTIIGNKAVIQFTLYGGTGQYRIDSPRIVSPTVLSGGEGQIRFTMTRIG